MIITCKECNASFNLDDGLIKQTGSKVKCSNCNHIFVVYPPAVSDEPGQSTQAKLIDKAEQDTENLALPQEKKETDDLELELDMDMEPSDIIAPEGMETVSDQPDELDLSDIDELLEMDDEPEEKTQKPPEDDLELELDMDMEPSDIIAPEGMETVSDQPDELDLSDIDELLEMDDEPEIEEEIELEDQAHEFNMGEEFEEKKEIYGAVASEESLDRLDTQTYTEESETTPGEKLKPAAKKKVSLPLIIILLIILVLAGAYGIYFLSNNMGIKIPFISDQNPQVQEPGNLMISTFDINSRFIENSKSGKFFVITGQVKNGYSETRSAIKITGKLYKKGKILAKTETVFCGNVLSDIDLSNQDVEAIKKRLKNASNIKVGPGKTLPFMLVFYDLPDSLEEFTIEVIDSVPLQ